MVDLRSQGLELVLTSNWTAGKLRGSSNQPQQANRPAYH